MDSDPFEAAQKEHREKHHRCEFCKEIKKLSPTRRIQLRDAMLGKTKVSGHKIAHQVISDVLAGWGISAGVTTIGNHAKGRSSQRDLSSACRNNVATAWGADNAQE